MADAVLGHKDPRLSLARYHGRPEEYRLAEKRDALTKWGILLFGVAIGGCLAAGLLALLWRSDAATPPRHRANLPSPWERKLWR